MRRKVYFFAIGIIELIIFGLVFAYWLIVILGLSFDAQWALKIAKLTEGSYTYYNNQTRFAPLLTSDKFALWVAFFIFSSFGPAFGLLCVTVSKLIDDDSPNTTTFDYSAARINKLEKEIDQLQKQIGALEHQIKGPEPVFDETPVTNEEPENSDVHSIVRKDKNSYQLGDKVQLNSDFEFEGEIIKKGSTGVIDNWLLSSLGKTYVVILDGSKKEIHIRGEYFE